MKNLKIEDIIKAADILKKYISDKQVLEQRILENDRFYRLQHWENKPDGNVYKAKSGWLLNSLMNKHADAMDNFPQAVVLPRHADDVEQASILSKLLPIILRQNNYEGVYSDMWWNKLKTGTAIQGVFWSPRKRDNVGDISIKNIDILRLYWEQGIEDIQDSRNIFYISHINKEDFIQQYPHVKDFDSDILPEEDKLCLVDWYYKLYNSQGKQIMHYCKFMGKNLLYASQNQEELSEIGFYRHGKYPFVVDRLFTVAKSPVGFGYIDIMKDTQMYIDSMNSIILNHAKLASQKRFFIRIDGGVNEKEFADWKKNFVHVAGPLNNESIREININPLDESCFRILGAKIDELKEISGNRDFNQGSTTGGITAASAIAALQEAGNKLSRDMIKSAYRSFTELCYLCVELVRQFYNTPRTLNIIDEGKTRFVRFNNEDMQYKTQHDGVGTNYRLPEYDIVIQPQKANPFSTLAQNELAKEFYRLGFFEPQNAKQALQCIAMMSFDGKEELIVSLERNGEFN